MVERFKNLTSVWWDVVALGEKLLKSISYFVLDHLEICSQVMIIALILLILLIIIQKIKASKKRVTSFPEIDKLKTTKTSPQKGDPAGFYLLIMYVVLIAFILLIAAIYIIHYMKL